MWIVRTKQFYNIIEAQWHGDNCIKKNRSTLYVMFMSSQSHHTGEFVTLWQKNLGHVAHQWQGFALIRCFQLFKVQWMSTEIDKMESSQIIASRVQLEGGGCGWDHNLALFIVCCFCPHFPELFWSTALKMTKVVTKVLWYCPLSPALLSSWLHTLAWHISQNIL